MLVNFIKSNQLDFVFERNALNFYIPLADNLVQQRAQTRKTFFVGINGCQGSGKSTLALFLAAYIRSKHSLSVAVLSLDDFYLDQKSRQQLADGIHPLYKVRGVPGTHNTQLMDEVFTALRNSNHSVALPRFDKSSDSPVDSKEWPNIKAPVDIVLIEGWCWGVPAQQQEMLNKPVNDLEEHQDQDAIWRSRVNRYIEKDYMPLYRQMNYWLMLKAPAFSCVLKWRFEQEHKLAVMNPEAKNIMSKREIAHFISHFQRLTEYAIEVMPSICNDVFYLDEERNIIENPKK